jgi:hypothetical protein
MVAEYRNFRSGDVAHGMEHVLDLLVLPQIGEHNVIVENRRHVLQHRQLQAMLLDGQPQLDEVAQLPAAPGTAGRQC